MFPYSKSGQVLRCPDDRYAADRRNNGTVPTGYPVSYSYNYNLANGAALASMNAPASTVVLTEVKGDTANAVVAGEVPLSSSGFSSSSGDGINVLYYKDQAVNSSHVPTAARPAWSTTAAFPVATSATAPTPPRPAP